MKITGLKVYSADAGWNRFGHLKIETDTEIVGWSEFSEERARRGVSALLRTMSDSLIGVDPRRVGAITAELYRDSRGAVGGVKALACGAIENALLDIKARDLNIPVYELLGGRLRDTVPVYWTHCGMNRARHRQYFDKPIRSLDDIADLGREVVAAGYSTLKTNILSFDADGTEQMVRGTDSFGRYLEPWHVDAAVSVLDAFRAGGGQDLRLAIDINFNFKPDGYRRLARAMEPLDLMWLEADTLDASALAVVRHGTSTPIASLETILGRRALMPFLAVQSVDIAIIDAVFNGVLEATRMAALCDTHEVNIAAHNPWGPLGAAISCQFCAVVPNLRIMEYEVDTVPWVNEWVDVPLEVTGGAMTVPTGPGWGVDINEAAIKKYSTQ
jgi:L-alanine-DL-glutamate epimerase-like enolase superfamily enzyme